MSLKISKLGDQSFERLSFLIAGEPGRGKTSLVRTLAHKADTVFDSPEALALEDAYDWNKVLYVAADPGQLAIRRLKSLNVFRPDYGGALSDIAKHLKAEAKTLYNWVIIDGLNNLGEVALKTFKDREAQQAKPNMMRAYGELADYMKPWIETVRDCGVNVIFITHLDKDPEADIRYTPMFPGAKLANQLDGMFDEVLCLRIARRNETSPPERLLQCKPEGSPLYQTKDRSGKLNAFEKPNLAALWEKIFNA